MVNMPQLTLVPLLLVRDGHVSVVHCTNDNAVRMATLYRQQGNVVRFVHLNDTDVPSLIEEEWWEPAEPEEK